MGTSRDAYLGLDIGGTGAKAGVFDRDGRPLGFGQRAYKPQIDTAGHAELPIEQIYEACRDASREAVAASEAEILALSVSSQGQTFVSLDEAGRPLHPAIIWYDSRAAQQAKQMTEALRETAGKGRGLDLQVVASAAKIRWLAENHPAVMKRARRFLLLPDYISYRLAGRGVFDATMASTTGLYVESLGEYCSAALDVAGVKVEQMSAVQPAGTPVGNLLPLPAQEWGLTERTVMTVGTNDQLAGALGAGNCRPGIGSETTGTCLALITLSRSVPTLPPGLFSGLFPIPDLRFVLAYCKTAGLLLEWFQRELAGVVTLTELDAAASTVPPGSRGLTVLPHFDGMVSPTPNLASRGVICNLNLNHSRNDIYRAILESLAFSLRENLELMETHGFPMRTLRAIGGGARSDIWVQIKADVCGVPIERPVVREAAVLGAAMLAAAGHGDFGSVGESSKRLYRVQRVFEPDRCAHQAYEEPYREYRRLQSTLFPAVPEPPPF